MDHRTGPIADEDLDLEIEAALGVDPSPWLMARVRATVTNQPMRSRVPWAWAIGLVCVVMVAVVMTIGMGNEGVARLKPSPTGLPSPTVASAPSVRNADSLTPVEIAKQGLPVTERTQLMAKSGVSVADEPIPEVIIDPEDMRAFQQLITSTRERRFEATFDPTPPSTSWAMTELSVAPIVIEPLEPSVANN